MGACQCCERPKSEDNGQLVIRRKFSDDNGYDTNLETHHGLKSKGGLGIGVEFHVEEEQNIPEKETPKEEVIVEEKIVVEEASAEDPKANVYAEEISVKEEVVVKSKANNNLQVEVGLAEETDMLPLPSPSMGRYHSYVADKLDSKEELDVYDISNEIFRLLNDIRTNSQAYEPSVEPKFKNVFRQLSEESADHILWSQKFYDIAFDYFNNLSDRRVSTTEVNSYLTEKINEVNEEVFTLTTISYIGARESVEKTLWALLNQNSSEIRSILLKNFHVGFVCNIPVNPSQDRTILTLANRNEN